LRIPDGATVVLFAGRFTVGKGVDVIADVVRRFADRRAAGAAGGGAAGGGGGDEAWGGAAADEASAAPASPPPLVFLFVGNGTQLPLVEALADPASPTAPWVRSVPPVTDAAALAAYYAASDVLLLPSANEGVALVVYEAMAAGLLVMTTDVGGQAEVVTPHTGVLLPADTPRDALLDLIGEHLEALSGAPDAIGSTAHRLGVDYAAVAAAGAAAVATRFTKAAFLGCVSHALLGAPRQPPPPWLYTRGGRARVAANTAVVVERERRHGVWQREQVRRPVAAALTVGIKSYVCDASVGATLRRLVASIRDYYPAVRVLIANDGPLALSAEPWLATDAHAEELRLAGDSGISVGRNALVDAATTPYILLLDDDHLFDEQTDLARLVRAADGGGGGGGGARWDVLGMRVRNLPGIAELESHVDIVIPRYVARVTAFRGRRVTLCVWNENLGPSVVGLTTPLRVDVVHNALLGRVAALRRTRWRGELKVNEHLSFFLDARAAGLAVGYLPSVFVHHRPRAASACYRAVRFREESFRRLLDYEDELGWDKACGDAFPERVRAHMAARGEGRR